MAQGELFGSGGGAPVPDGPLEAVSEAAQGCKACDLWKTGTQTVFGEGGEDSVVMFVGEQPGNDEDLEGRPFVGPAGRVLDQALEEAGIDRAKAYVTNAVKHFKWTPKGKRRIHQKPNWTEMTACRPWLEAEIDRVRPEAVVALGATAAQTLLGRDFRVTKQRGVPVDSPIAPVVIATVHPSSILRAGDDAARAAALADLVADLREVAKLIPRR